MKTIIIFLFITSLVFVRQVNSQTIEEWKILAEEGKSYAQCYLGLAYYNGDGVLKDYKEAFKWYKKAAEQGDVNAQYGVGACYYLGQGVLKDYKEAVIWYKKAANQDNKYAQYSLGICYCFGEGVILDKSTAKYWIKLSYENGYDKAKVVWEEFELWKY